MTQEQRPAPRALNDKVLLSVTLIGESGGLVAKPRSFTKNMNGER